MRNLFVLLLALMLCAPMSAHAGSFDPATTITQQDGATTLAGSGYTRLSLVKMTTDETGQITVDGTATMQNGTANIILWAKVNEKYFFSKMRTLQGFSADSPVKFSIPFNAEKHRITELIIEAELPAGGILTLDNLDVSAH